MEEDFKPVVQHQRRVNPKIHDVIKQEVIKLLEDGLIYLISDSPWVSLVHCVPKNGGFTVVENEDNELIPTRLMLERLVGNQYYCSLDGFSGYFQIPVDLKDQEKTTFTCPYGTFAYRRMPFGLCNAPGTFQRPMTRLLEKDTPFNFSKECVEAFQTLKRKLTKAPILIALDWDMPFELMCDASNFAIGAVLGQCQDKHFRPIHYASKTMTKVESNYTTTEKEMLAMVYALKIKEKTKRLHDSKIKDRVFNISDRVLLFNSRLKIFFGKLKSRWSGPFSISQVYPYGTVELSQPDGPNFKVNGHRLKHYFGEDVPKVVVPDLQTFPRDH
nr:hypothetical protein [Tanacetum cinerariifolium]